MLRFLLCVLGVFIITHPALACPTSPATGGTDMIMRFMPPSGGHAGTLSASSVANKSLESTLLYDPATKTLILCDGTNWIPLRTTAAGTAGQIQFNDGTGKLAADSNLHWDNINKRIGIGTNTPQVPFEVISTNHQQQIRATRLSNTHGSGVTISPAGVITPENPMWWYGLRPNDTGFSLGIFNGTTSPPAYFYTSPEGNIGINTTTPAAKLDVNGTIRTRHGVGHRHFELASFPSNSGTSCETDCGTKYCLGAYLDNASNIKATCDSTTYNRNCMCIGR